MIDLKIKEIPYGSDLYHAELALRDQVLRRPLGMCLYDENLEGEREDWHIAAMDGDRLIGILILTKIDETTVKMRQVAVDDACRERGIGREMVLFAESLSLSRGIRTIRLHARESAIPFYLKLGYTVSGEVFTEVTLPHRTMVKALTAERSMGSV